MNHVEDEEDEDEVGGGEELRGDEGVVQVNEIAPTPPPTNPPGPLDGLNHLEQQELAAILAAQQAPLWPEEEDEDEEEVLPGNQMIDVEVEVEEEEETDDDEEDDASAVGSEGAPMDMNLGAIDLEDLIAEGLVPAGGHPAGNGGWDGDDDDETMEPESSDHGEGESILEGEGGLEGEEGSEFGGGSNGFEPDEEEDLEGGAIEGGHDWEFIAENFGIDRSGLAYGLPAYLDSLLSSARDGEQAAIEALDQAEADYCEQKEEDARINEAVRGDAAKMSARKQEDAKEFADLKKKLKSLKLDLKYAVQAAREAQEHLEQRDGEVAHLRRMLRLRDEEVDDLREVIRRRGMNPDEELDRLRSRQRGNGVRGAMQARGARGGRDRSVSPVARGMRDDGGNVGGGMGRSGRW